MLMSLVTQCVRENIFSFSCVCFFLLPLPSSYPLCPISFCFQELGQHSQCSDQILGWTVQGLNAGMGQRFISSPKCPQQLWGPPSLLLIWYWCSFPGVKWVGHEVNHSPPSNAEVKNAPTLPMPSTHIQGKFYLFTVHAFASVF